MDSPMLPSNTDKRRPSPAVLQPYIDAGRITQAEVEDMATGFYRSGQFLQWGAVAGSLLTFPLWSRVRPNSGFLERLAVGTMGSIGGAAVGGGIGATQMRKRLSSIPPEQALGKITLFQELTLHSNNPAYPAPPLDPTHLSALQTSLNRATAASGTVPFKGRLFPMPGMQNREDGSGGGTVEGVEGGGGMRDSQGRLFPGQVAGRRTGEDENGNMGGDAELLERRMEKERESETGLSDREASSTSWALLRSRSNQPPSAETLSTLSSSPSSDFSTNSVPSPSIPLSSSPSSSSPPSSRQQPMTDRQREQAEFDRLLERERSATDAYGGGPQATGSAGDKWAELRGRNLGGGRMGGGAEADYRAPKAPAGEVVW